MKYYVIQSSNETVSVVSEWSDLNSAIVAYHDRCKILWNTPEVVTGVVMLVDSALNTVGGYREFITHEQEEVVAEEPSDEVVDGAAEESVAEETTDGVETEDI